jgi:uncharacterized protein YutE (UPF0331/DUF86 family)
MEPRWRKLGYVLEINPKPEQLPTFLRGIRPDAIALGPKPNLVIEVLRARGPTSDIKVRQLKSLLEGQDAWQLEVIYSTSEGELVEPATKQEIRSTLENARQLSVQDTRAGLLLAWASLEAIGRQLEPDLATGSLSPRSLVDLLISTGHLPQGDGAFLRKTGDVRNAIAHGQLSLEPDSNDVRELIEVAERLAA